MTDIPTIVILSIQDIENSPYTLQEYLSLCQTYLRKRYSVEDRFLIPSWVLNAYFNRSSKLKEVIKDMFGVEGTLMPCLFTKAEYINASNEKIIDILNTAIENRDVVYITHRKIEM